MLREARTVLTTMGTVDLWSDKWQGTVQLQLAHTWMWKSFYWHGTCFVFFSFIVLFPRFCMHCERSPSVFLSK